ncbi:PilZ domain-containing protein [Candidatus Omnitrophota bacterium]
MEEKREFTRFKTSMTVIYRIGNGRNETVSRLEDVSREGMRLSDQSPVSAGMSLELNIVVPGHDAPVVAMARSVWCKKTDDYAYKKGLRFTDIHRTDLKRLLNCVTY